MLHKLFQQQMPGLCSTIVFTLHRIPCTEKKPWDPLNLLRNVFVPCRGRQKACPGTRPEGHLFFFRSVWENQTGFCCSGSEFWFILKRSVPVSIPFPQSPLSYCWSSPTPRRLFPFLYMRIGYSLEFRPPKWEITEE